MKVIDLLNKIANGEEVPKKIKVFGEEFNYDGYDYYSIHSSSPLMSYVGKDYLRAEMNYDIKIIEEPKGIPKKIDIIGWDKCIHGVSTKEKELAIEINKTQKLLNQVLDYLKSKGE